MENRWIKDHSQEYHKAGFALFLTGFTCFSLLYQTQPLLPDFARSFGVSAAESSLALSLTTGTLALSIMVFAATSQTLGRRGLMFVCMGLAALLNLVAALAPGWHGLLAIRALQGLLLGGVPAVAMAWLAEEIEPTALGKTMGLYVAGTAFGGMIGRIGVGLLAAEVGWQTALFLWGLLCVLTSVGFFKFLPKSQNFRAVRTFRPFLHLRIWKRHLQNRSLLRLFLVGFTLTSIFVTILNYAAFRLSAAPFHLDPSYTSWIYLTFLVGMATSTVAGGLQQQFQRNALLKTAFTTMACGLLITLFDSLTLSALGFVLVTAGFFIGHSVASGSVGILAPNYKGHATALYLLFYYLGSSVIGTAGGWFWQTGGWAAVIGLTVSLALFGATLSSNVRLEDR